MLGFILAIHLIVGQEALNTNDHYFHTKIKNHSKEFWAEVSKYLPNWKELDERMGDMKV